MKTINVLVAMFAVLEMFPNAALNAQTLPPGITKLWSVTNVVLISTADGFGQDGSALLEMNDGTLSWVTANGNITRLPLGNLGGRGMGGPPPLPEWRYRAAFISSQTCIIVTNTWTDLVLTSFVLITRLPNGEITVAPLPIPGFFLWDFHNSNPPNTMFSMRDTNFSTLSLYSVNTTNVAVLPTPPILGITNGSSIRLAIQLYSTNSIAVRTSTDLLNWNILTNIANPPLNQTLMIPKTSPKIFFSVEQQ